MASGLDAQKSRLGWLRISLRCVLTHRRRLAVFIAPWVLALCVVFPLLWRQVDSSSQAVLARDREKVLDQTEQTLGRSLDRLGRDALFMGDLDSRLPWDDMSQQSVRAKILLSFAANVPDYDQLRWIDETGRERLRVSHRGDTDRAELVPQSALQDRSTRPYFTEAMALGAKGIFLSAFDLDAENDRAGTPVQPMLRVSTPVFEGDARRGVVVINYHAGTLLKRIRMAAGDAKLYLVNAAGYWLDGPRPEDNWGWLLGHGERTLAAAYPAVWQSMQHAENGVLRDSTGYWAFRWYKFGANLLSSGDASAVSSKDPGVFLLFHVDDGGSFSREAQIKLVLVLLGVALLSMMIAMSLGLGRSLEREAMRTRQVREANRTLSETNEKLQLAQKELARAERLSSLGLMVAGVAHELNTPLGSATLTLSKAKQDLAGLEDRIAKGLRRSDLDIFLTDSRESLDLAQDAIRKSSALVQRFKQVTVDRATLQRRETDLTEVVLDADPRLKKWDASGGISLNLQLADGLRLESYPGPLGQLVSNLLNNALKHAFPEGQGSIDIRTQADGAGHVLIEVTDDGCGIGPSDLPHIFEPFYTTARHSGGTGLGLHIVHSLVTEVLGGTILVESPASAAAEGGTRVRVRLPRVAPIVKSA